MQQNKDPALDDSNASVDLSVTTTGRDLESESGEGMSLAKTGALQVNRSKFLVYIALAAAASVVSSMIFAFLKNDEEEEMKAEVSYTMCWMDHSGIHSHAITRAPPYLNDLVSL